MRAKTIFALLFLLSLGLVGLLVMRAMPQTAVASAPPPPKDEILVAAAPLAGGTLLRAQDIRWLPRPGDAQSGEIVRPPEAARNLKPAVDEETRAAVYGAAMRHGVAAGEPLLLASIAKPGDRDFLLTVLTQGTRAITIPVTAAAGATGLMFPGDHVDVILTQTFRNNEDAPLTRRSVSETVVENLRVLAIDAAKGNAADRMVTLEVVPQQAEKINVGAELGKLSLTLRSLSETDTGGAVATAAAKPTWAGDVSPALRATVPPVRVIQAEKPSVKVMRGNKTEDIKPE